MKFCRECGSEIREEAVLCPKCGCMVQSAKLNKQTNEENNATFNVFSFILPILGVIFGLVYLDSNPARSKGCFKWAAISFVISMILGLFIWFMGMILFI